MQDNFSLNTKVDPSLPVRGTGSSTTPDSSGAGESFDSALSAAMRGVEQLQSDANQQAAMQALGAGNLHENAIALEKADIAMRLLVKTRSKIVDAYQEVMRMSI